MQTVNSSSSSKSASSSGRHRRSRGSYRCEARLRRYRYLLAGVSLVFVLVTLFTWFYAERKSGEARQARLEMRIKEKALKTLGNELDKVRKERDVLVRKRIPDLLPLTYDEAITTDNDYIRNIIFTVVKNGNKEAYEYRLVLHNETLSVIHPVIKILLFNDVGIQIGLAEVEQSDAATGRIRAALDPGEVRTYSDAIKLVGDEEPRYFLLSVTEANTASVNTLREHLGDVITP